MDDALRAWELTGFDPASFADQSCSLFHPRRLGWLQSCGAKIHAESFAPNGHRTISRQVQITWQYIVLVADVSFDHSQVDESSVFDGRRILGIVSGDHVNVYIRPVRRIEVREPQD